MKTISNKLWMYNRYRFIMTYHKKPWLPPPLILLSHVTSCASAAWHKHRGASRLARDSSLSESTQILSEYTECGTPMCKAVINADSTASMPLLVPVMTGNRVLVPNRIFLFLPELFLAPDDLKKLHEFEERCVAGYFRDKRQSQNSSQINRIRHAADKYVPHPATDRPWHVSFFFRQSLL